MRVLILGASGHYGSVAARRVAASDLVSEVAIAGRRYDALAQLAGRIGGKARPVQLDLRDERHVAAAAGGFDVVVNVAGPEWDACVPGLRAAIAAGVHYCDIGAVGRVTEEQLRLDGAAKERNVTAVVGIGLASGIDNLIAMHLSRALDTVEEFEIRHHWLSAPYLTSALQQFRESGHLETPVLFVLRLLSEPTRVYRNGDWATVHPLEGPVEVTIAGYGAAQAFHIGTSEAVTLSRAVPSVRSARAVLIPYPPQILEVLAAQTRRIVRGELTDIEATRTFMQALDADPDPWLGMPDKPPAIAQLLVSVAATGRQAGSRVRYVGWPLKPLTSTTAALTVAALKILRGEIRARGVLTPEACFEPMPFFEEVASYMPEERGRPLLSETVERL